MLEEPPPPTGGTGAMACGIVAVVGSSARAATVDTGALAEALRREIGDAVRFDNGSRALYATDGSNYRQVPLGVVVPRTVDDVLAAVAVAREHSAPILPRGAGT